MAQSVGLAMSWKPAATANDWDRWKKAEVVPPMTITRVTIEGEIQGKRAKMEITQGFIEMQGQLKRANEALKAVDAILIEAKATMRQISWKDIQQLCREGLGQ